MRTFYKTFTRLTAAALLVAMMAAPGFAAKTTPATDKNTNVPAVPRAIPDLVPYHNFDPPAGAVFDPTKLTISGDMRVRPEYRNNGNLQHNTGDPQNNFFFTQQFIRLGFHYELSPDVVFFLQPAVASTFGAVQSGHSGINPNTTGTNLYMRQGFMLVRNFLIPNLSLKAGRQLVVWGNHRIFGHFDWNNVGFSLDGVTMRYNHAQVPVELGWLVVAEGNCGQNTGACNGAGAGGANGANNGDANILFARLPMKFGSVAIEPSWILEEGGAGAASPIGGQQNDQTRHTVGARIAFKKGMVDATTEGYYQFGNIGAGGAGSPKGTINAGAFHLDGGVTMPVPMQPRIGAEFNYATGSDNSSTNNRHTFSQLFPTNHIHFGYMDLMSWQNMVTYGGNLQLRPTAESHFEIAGTGMRLAQEEDCWYGAAQGCNFGTTPNAANDESSLGWELDVVYTLFFQNNKVGWQFGYGHFFTGDYISKNDKGNGTGQFANAADQNWGYTQLWINF